MVLITPSPRTLALTQPASSSSSSSSPNFLSPPAPPSAHPLKHSRSLTSLLASSPSSTSPASIRSSRHYLPKPNLFSRLWVRFVSDGGTGVERKRGERTEEEKRKERELVKKSGDWEGLEREPSELFLDIYGSVLQTLNHEPRSALVSPSLLGSTGTLPLTIISLIPDIMAHYATCIKNAKHEVLLFTNYWQPSDSQKTISDALRELSKRVGREGGKKIVVKLVYDRGTFQQLIQNHSPVAPELWSAIDLPTADEIPHLEMQVVNYHRPLVGTFHSKFLVIDREIGLLNSNNIQDRPNLEMMMHLEGPIVQSLYDTALISFANPMIPTLPLLAVPPPPETLAGFGFQDSNPWLKEVPLSGAAEATRRLLESQRLGKQTEAKKAGRMKDLVRAIIEKEAETPVVPRQQSWFGEVGEGLEARLEGILAGVGGEKSPSTSRSNSRGPSRRQSVDVVHVHANDPPHHLPPKHAFTSPSTSSAPQAAAVPSSPTRGAPSVTSSNAIQTPLHTPPESPTLGGNRVFASSPDPLDDRNPHLKDDTQATTVVEDPDDLSEDDSERVRGSSEKTKRITISDPPIPEEVLGRLAKMTKRLNAGVLSEPLPTVDDSDAIDQFMPHMLHAPHKPFPMVLVNRKPRGMPGHQDLRNPQNAAWLAGFKFAKKRIFIQTPTWNARPAVDAAIDACKRGVEVILYLGLGFNDKGESIPFQGGTNEEVVVRMFKTLRKCGKENFLKCYWYVGKDQSRPLNAAIKQRNCHVKLAIFDDCVGMAGNGNQDTQSWYHSQEVNVLLDSRQVCEDWINGLHHNQNTHIYGQIDTDGIWRDPTGATVAVLDRKKEEARLALERNEARAARLASSSSETKV